MKPIRHTIAPILAGSCFALSSCGDLNAPLTGGGDMLMSPGLSAGGLGTTSASLLKGSRALVGYRVGRATPEQSTVAENRGRAALSRTQVKKRIEKEKVRYVAVPVKPAAGQKTEGRPAIIKVDTLTGKPSGDVYAPAKGQELKSGDTIKLGGDPTLFFASAADKI